MAISKCQKFFDLDNYVRVIVFESNLQRAFFHGVTNFLLHNIIAQLLSLYIYKTLLFEPRNLDAMIKNSLSVLYLLWRANSCRIATPIGTRVLPTKAIANFG